MEHRLEGRTRSAMLIASEEDKAGEMKITDMASKQEHHFVLVHGIGGGAWCWYKLRCLMENSGYKVTCIDLTSAGIDRSDASSVLSFDEYSKPLLDFLSALPENQKVVSVLRSPLTDFLAIVENTLLRCSIVFLAGDSGRAQRRRAERDTGESPVREEDRTSCVRGSHDAEIWVPHRSGSHGCKFLLTRAPFSLQFF